MVVFPPIIQRPPAANDFNPSAQVSVGPGPGATATPDGLTVEIPSGQVGVIRSFALQVNDLADTSDLTWALLTNGSPVRGWDQLTVFPRVAASVTKVWAPEETYIPLPEGATVSVRITVEDGSTYDIGGNYHGWYYPQTMQARYEGAWG